MNSIAPLSDSQDDKDLKDLFDSIVHLIRSTPTVKSEEGTANSTVPISDDDKLKLYAYYKVATEKSPPQHPRPSIFNVVKRAKYNAWEDAASQLSTVRDAMESYIDFASICLSKAGFQIEVEKLKAASADGKRIPEPKPTVLPDVERIAKTSSCIEEKGKSVQSHLIPPKLQKHKYNFMPRPIIARGTLDISYYDLFYAMWMSVLPHYIHAKTITRKTNEFERITSEISLMNSYQALIEDQWIDNFTPHSKKKDIQETIGAESFDATESISSPSVVVGLSVRSLLDLYLQVRSYPAGSEIIITPPLNIKGMIDIMVHTHNLKVVPIDLPQENTIGINLNQIEKAVTSRTVAVMVVHPFGKWSLSSDEMKRLSTGICQQYSLDLLEDCAECFTGSRRKLATTNEYATISFYSFGLIKTATALGGAIAYFPPQQKRSKHNHDISTTMKQLQKVRQSTQLQSKMDYLSKVIKSIILKCISDSPYLVGIVAYFCNLFGVTYENFVSSLVKAFPEDQHKYSKQSIHDQHLHRMKKLRCAPCTGLYALLSKRLHCYKYTRVTKRIKRCVEVMNLLNETDSMQEGRIRIPLSYEEAIHAHPNASMFSQHASNLFWLFPILVDDPDGVCEIMMNHGFDVPRGTSQLACIESFLEQGEKCPNAKGMMRKVLYLPIASKVNMASDDLRRMIKVLDWAASVSTKSQGKKCEIDLIKKRDTASKKNTAIAYLCVFLICNLMVPSFFQHAAYVGNIILWITSFVIIGVAAVRLICSRRYLRSNEFMKYNSMLTNSRGDFLENNKSIGSSIEFDGANVKSGDPKCDPDNKPDIFESIDVLKIPSVQSLKNSDTQPAMAFVTGSTGFIGTLLVRTLLLHRQRLNISGGVVLLCRPKSNKSAFDRIYNHIMNDPIFSFLTKSEFEKLVHVVEGEVTSPHLGMSKESLEFLSTLNVTHVFHVAASVSFVQPLDDAALNIITPSLQMQSLAKTGFRSPAKYIHFSTAFVHGDSTGKIVSEELFDLGKSTKYTAFELYKSMLGTQSLAWVAMHEFGFPNTYTFAKSVSEHLLLQNGETNDDTIIVRPSIVGPSVTFPYEGWSGKKPSTLVAAACLYLKFQWSLWCFGKTNVPVVPVDVVVYFTIRKAFQDSLSSDLPPLSPTIKYDREHHSEYLCARSESSDEDALVIDTDIDSYSENVDKQQKQIYNVTWDHKSPDTHTFQWADFAIVLTHVGRVKGYFGSFTAYLTLFVAQNIRLSKEQQCYYHNLLVKYPYGCILWVSKRLGMNALTKNMSRMTPFLDLPLLFFHFNNHNFNFESELQAPKGYNGERYMVNCVLAAENFISKLNKKLESSSNSNCVTTQSPSAVMVAGKNHKPLTSDLWWALTQPRGNIFIRIAGMILIKIFRSTTTELTVDLHSFRSLIESMDKQKEVPGGSNIVLAPTHRSLFDFLILSFVCFSIPEIGIYLPHIAAADDFQALWFLGWFAKGAQAFFLKRGTGKEDPDLKNQIEKLKKNETNSVFEVFLEGQRSRDRRFIDPKTGFLRCLVRTGGEHVILPLSISYERIPEQYILVKESNSGRRGALGLRGLLRWLSKVYTDGVNIGRVHIQASSPAILPENEMDIKSIARTVQLRQKQIIFVSEYHIDAGAELLQISSHTITVALESLGCRFWKQSSDPRLSIPESKSELWTVMLQYGFWFSPFLSESHPKWSHWLDTGGAELGLILKGKQVNDAVVEVANALIQKFEEAESAVANVLLTLKSKGFASPTSRHVTQITKKEYDYIPLLLIRAGVDILLGDSSPQQPKLLPSQITSTKVVPLFRESQKTFETHRVSSVDNESVGAWGYKDSGFTLHLDENGSKNVIMKGNRYSFSGRKMPRIVGFLEKEMLVTVDPCKVFLSPANNLGEFHTPKSGIDNSGIMTLLSTFGNDQKRVSTASVDRVRHGSGHTQEDMIIIRSNLFKEFRVPDVVVWPLNEREIEKLITLCTEKDWCLIPFGGGTNVTHATWCPTKQEEPRPIISVDMKLMNKILWINEEDGTAHVQAGITGGELFCEMKKKGLTIGHEPDSIEFSTLGGWVATKASGMKQNRYGNIEDIVVSVRVADARGLMWQHHDVPNNITSNIGALGRVSTGIDLKSLMLGSEGCLGIITSVIIKVWPVAERMEYESVIISDFDSGIDFVRDVSKLRGLKPASVRLVDNEQFRMAQALSEETKGLSKIMESILKITGSLLHSFSPDSIVAVTITYEGSNYEVDLQKSIIQKLVKKHGAILSGPKIGKAGYDLTFAIAYLRDFAMTYHFVAESFETFVPWSMLSNLVKKIKQRIVKEFNLRMLPGRPMISVRVTQLYDNGACLYFYFCMNVENVQRPSEVFAEIERCAREEIIKQGGSLSHHHGIGKHRRSFMNDTNSKTFRTFLREMKKAVDPNTIFGARNGSFAQD